MSTLRLLKKSWECVERIDMFDFTIVQWIILGLVLDGIFLTSMIVTSIVIFITDRK